MTIIVNDDKIIYCPTSVAKWTRIKGGEGKNKENILLFHWKGGSKIMNV